MTYTIAVQPDRAKLLDDRREWSDHFVEAIRAAGHQVRPVDLRGPDPLGQLEGCDALMWRYSHVEEDYTLANRLLPVIERYLGLVVYPDQNTCWHYDDKIAQAYLFDALGIPTPQSWIFWRLADALEFCREAQYPLVAKLSRGAGSSNVKLIESRDQAEQLISRMFGRGLRKLDAPERAAWRRRLRNAARWLVRGYEPMPGWAWVLHKNYVLLQEFLPGNAFDTRVNVIGNRAFGIRRFNRDNDFRASGSGRPDQDPAEIDPRFLRLAFRIASSLQTQSCAMDGLYRAGEPCVSEISYTHPTKNIYKCPGHWVLEGDWESGELRWQPGKMWPQDAVVADLLQKLEQRNPVRL